MNDQIAIVVPTMQPCRLEVDQRIAEQLKVDADTITFIHNSPEHNLGVVGSLQAGYEQTTAPIIAYTHDDVQVHDANWLTRVLAEFDDPTVGLVGLGGALCHGHPDIYKRPYSLVQLARFNYLSNQTDWAVHGGRFTGACSVAVLDGFCLVIRRTLLDLAGGWPVGNIIFHGYDYYAALIAHRYGFQVRLVGASCTHSGGATSTQRDYQGWLTERGTSDAQTHIQAHRWLYENFRDCLPWSCPAPRQEA